MPISRGLAAVIITITAVTASPATAQYPEYGQILSIGGFAGSLDLSKMFGESSFKADAGPMFGGQLAVGVTPAISVIGGYYLANEGFFSLDGSDEIDGSMKTALYDVGLQIRRPIHHLALFSPFLQGGYGYMNMTRDYFNDSEVQSGPTFNVAAGLDLQFGNTFALRVMARDFISAWEFESDARPFLSSGTGPVRAHNLALMAGITLGF